MVSTLDSESSDPGSNSGRGALIFGPNKYEKTSKNNEITEDIIPKSLF